MRPRPSGRTESSSCAGAIGVANLSRSSLPCPHRRSPHPKPSRGCNTPMRCERSWILRGPPGHGLTPTRPWRTVGIDAIRDSQRCPPPELARCGNSASRRGDKCCPPSAPCRYVDSSLRPECGKYRPFPEHSLPAHLCGRMFSADQATLPRADGARPSARRAYAPERKKAANGSPVRARSVHGSGNGRPRQPHEPARRKRCCAWA
jgi:hypothetical protein